VIYGGRTSTNADVLDDGPFVIFGGETPPSPPSPPMSILSSSAIVALSNAPLNMSYV